MDKETKIAVIISKLGTPVDDMPFLGVRILDKEIEIAKTISKLGTMINDWAETADEDIKESAKKLIIETARKLVAVADEKI